MKCVQCQEQLKLTYKLVVADTLIKYYHCVNGHEMLIRRYGDTIDMAGNASGFGKNKVHTDDWYTPKC